jgi:D-sedoheptulose 7-phosphate isomerase
VGVGVTHELREVARARFRASTEIPAAFFEANAEQIALACRDLARAFHAGHRLLVLGDGAQWSDAVHVSVEFVHPVIVGKRALPAIAFRGDDIAQLRTIAEPGDAALGLFASGDPAPVREALAAARASGLLTIALVGSGGEWTADHMFAVPSADAFIVQEIHETLYHVLWEQVHVFLEHPGTLK